MTSQFPREEAIGVVGCGRMAQALGRLLAARGEPVAAIAGRSQASAHAAAKFIGGADAVTIPGLPERARRIIIAVPDAAIREVASALAAGMDGGTVLHTSGACGLEPLEPLSAHGVSCGSLHPLQTVASPAQGVAALPGSAFAVSGQGPATEWAVKIVALLEGHLLNLPGSVGPLYHAAAVMAGNYIITVLDAAASLLAEAGIERSSALRALGPLARESLANALNQGPVDALTGPIERGDAATVEAHLSAIDSTPGLETIARLYRAAGLQTIELAARGGLPPNSAAELAALLSERETIHA